MAESSRMSAPVRRYLLVVPLISLSLSLSLSLFFTSKYAWDLPGWCRNLAELNLQYARRLQRPALLKQFLRFLFNPLETPRIHHSVFRQPPVGQSSCSLGQGKETKAKIRSQTRRELRCSLFSGFRPLLL